MCLCQVSGDCEKYADGNEHQRRRASGVNGIANVRLHTQTQRQQHEPVEHFKYLIVSNNCIFEYMYFSLFTSKYKKNLNFF